MSITKFIYDKRNEMFCTTGFDGQVGTSFAFSFH